MADDTQLISLSEARIRRETSRQTAIAGHIGMRTPRANLFSFGTGPLPSLAAQEASHANLRTAVDQVVEVQPRGLVEGFVKTCQRWGLDQHAQAALLGYKENVVGALGILSGRVNIPSQDVRDRILSVIAISLTLGALFDERPEHEIAWLEAARRRFLGRSALDLLLSGRMTDLLAVVQLVRSERRP